MKTLISLLFAFACASVFAGDFSLRTLSDGTAEISAYTGTETSLYIPASVDGKRISRIGAWAFQGNSELKELTLPESLTSVGDGAFANCSALRCVAFPQNLKRIGARAFADCGKLRSVSLPDSLEFLGDEAFALCSSLDDVSAPTFVSRIGENVFPLSSAALYPESKFPRLEFVADSLKFSDPSGDSAIDGNENCTLRVSVSNEGNADAYACRFRIALRNQNAELAFPQSFGITKIPAGESVAVEIPIAASRALADGNADFVFAVDEPGGYGTDEHNLLVPTRPFVAPSLRIVDFSVSGQGASELRKKYPFDLQLCLQNTTAGTAENVVVELELPANVQLIDGEERVDFSKLSGGADKQLDYSLIVSGHYRGNTIPLKVKISEKYGAYAQNWETTLKLGASISGGKTVLTAKKRETPGGPIEIVSLSSEVDKNIPENPQNRSRNIFVAIVANENYEKGTAAVHYAKNDGKIFRDYCLKTLGVPENKIEFYPDAGAIDMQMAVDNLVKSVKLFGESSELIFYYSGHGFPDEASKIAYLLPTDTPASYLEHALPLNTLYEKLATSGAKCATVFLDACFSGMKKDGKPLDARKGVALASDIGSVDALPPNLIVFSAASGDQTAGFAHKEKHGLFTYVLLKKLQESRGKISFSELANYLTEKLPQESFLRERRSNPQKPSILVHEDFPHMNQKLYTPKED